MFEDLPLNVFHEICGSLTLEGSGAQCTIHICNFYKLHQVFKSHFFEFTGFKNYLLHQSQVKEKTKSQSYVTLLIQIRICIQGHPGCVFEPNSSITLRSSNSWKGHSKNEFYAYKYIKRLGTNACNSRFGHMYAGDNGKQRNTFSFRIKLSSLSNVVTCRSCGSMTTALFVSKSGCFRFF